MELNARRLIISDAIRQRSGKRTPADVLAEARRISIPNIINDVLIARGEKDYALASALCLDMVVCRMRELRAGREKYHAERRRAMEAGHTGDVVALELEWDAKLGREGNEQAIMSKAQKMISETLLMMYRDADGGMAHAEWERKAAEIMEALTAGISEKIAGNAGERLEFIELRVDEMAAIGQVWQAAVEDASEKIRAEERLPAKVWARSRKE